jgi:hypothetical protein
LSKEREREREREREEWRDGNWSKGGGRGGKAGEAGEGGVDSGRGDIGGVFFVVGEVLLCGVVGDG